MLRGVLISYFAAGAHLCTVKQLSKRLTTVVCVPVACLQDKHPLRAVDGIHANFICSSKPPGDCTPSLPAVKGWKLKTVLTVWTSLDSFQSRRNVRNSFCNYQKGMFSICLAGSDACRLYLRCVSLYV